MVYGLITADELRLTMNNLGELLMEGLNKNINKFGGIFHGGLTE